jgi:hypothetical protein
LEGESLSEATSGIDIIAFQRGDLLKQREEYVLNLVKEVEGDLFRQYKVITDYKKEFEKQQALSIEIERDVEKGARQGYGVISLSDSSVACVIAEPSNEVKDGPSLTSTEVKDGLEELLTRSQDVIAPKLTADWRFIDTSADLAFRSLQRKQCGCVSGPESDLKAILLALRKEPQLTYSFAPVWWTSADLSSALFDLRDKATQEIKKKAEQDRK